MIKIKRRTPYDFMAITDHAEYFGVMPRMIDPKDPLSKSDLAKRLTETRPNSGGGSFSTTSSRAREGRID